MGIYYIGSFPFDSDYLMHYGIKGQKWGIRRFQNPDGTLTEAGKKRYKANSAEEVASWIHESSAGFYVSESSRKHLAENTIQSFDKARKRLSNEVSAVKEAEKEVSSLFSKAMTANRNGSRDSELLDKQLDIALDKYDKSRDSLQKACRDYSKGFLGKFGDDSAASHRYQDEGLKIITVEEEYSDMLYDELIDGLYSKILRK